MNKYILYIFIFYSFSLFSQNEQLRIEMIDVFKEYDPEITNSSKISSQPIFLDTLKTQIFTNKPILMKQFGFKEFLPTIYTNKFRFNKNKSVYQKYLSLSMGSKSFLNTKFHYTSGLSTQHNSGIYFEHDSEAYFIKQDLDGQQFTFLQAYSNYFFNRTLLNAVLSVNNSSGWYWANLESYDIKDIEKYIGNSFSVKLHLQDRSNTNLFNNADVLVNYFHNNYGRSELFIHPSIDLKVEQSLRQYNFNINCQIVRAIFNQNLLELQNMPIGLLPIARIDNNDINNGFSDMLISSELFLSGSAIFDYVVGLNFQYLPNDKLQHGGVPLFFPNITLSKSPGINNKLSFSIGKELIYHSFNSLFENIPYISPDYQNSLSKDFKTTLSYMQKIHKDISLSSNINYIRKQGSLVPFVFTSFSEKDVANTIISDNSNLKHVMSPLGMYYDTIQRGVEFSTSLSLDKNKYNILLDGSLNFVKSKQFNDKQFDPKFKIRSVITLDITDRFNLISNWSFIGKRDVIQIGSLSPLDDTVNFSNLKSYVQTDLTLNYMMGAMMFSLDFQNILGQELDFFDGYYDDDGLKIHLGFVYKF